MLKNSFCRGLWGPNGGLLLVATCDPAPLTGTIEQCTEMARTLGSERGRTCPHIRLEKHCEGEGSNFANWAQYITPRPNLESL